MKRIVLGSLLVAAMIAPALSQVPTSRVRGTIASVAGGVLTVTTATGSANVMFAPDVRVQYIAKSSLDKVAAGSYIGTAAEPQPDGTLKALEIQVFPPGFTPGPGSRPYDLTATSTMTNGHVTDIAATKVDKVDAHVWTVGYEGGEKKVVVPPGIPVITYIPADASALTVGAHVIVQALKNDDGSYKATSIGVGKDGLTPPM